MPAPLVLNALVPFSTRLATDGLVHVRGWDVPGRPVLVVAEMDWALLVDDPADAYFGPGIFTYPGYALGAATAAARDAGLEGPSIVVSMPDPPGRRLDRVTDPQDPQGWEPLSLEDLREVIGGADPAEPAPGSYVPRVAGEWIRTGSLRR